MYGAAKTGGQFQSGLPVRFAAILPGWTITGANAMHAVEVSPGDFAPMLWSDDGSEQNRNKLTLTAGVGANDAGVNYTVTFDMSAAVYQNGSQATLDGDLLRIQVLNPVDALVAAFSVSPGAWTGTMSFTSATFSYLGDGSGVVRFEISTATGLAGRFAGSVDNFVVAVPEASTAVLMAAGAGLLVLLRLRRKSR